MSSEEITKSAAVRTNLQQLQNTQNLLDRTQERLATGKEINDALDGPQEFFASKTLTQRSDDLMRIKDSMGQGISTIEAANEATESIEGLLDQARGLADSALSNLGGDENSRQRRADLAQDFNSILQEIDDISEDASYQGKNLTVGDGRQIGADETSVEKVNNVTGLSSTRVTNVSGENQYRFSVDGNGEISGKADDQAKAQQERGLKDLRINGFQSRQAGNFEDIKIEVEGGAGSDKTITVTEGDESRTKTFDRDDLKVEDGRYFHEFDSGTTVQFKVDLDKMESVPKTAGEGTSTIEKKVDVGVRVRDGNGFERVRDGENDRGFNKLKEGENAFEFDDATVRTSVDSDKILQSSNFKNDVSEVYGLTGDVVTGKPKIENSEFSKIDGQDTRFNIQVRQTSPSDTFNYETGNFENYEVRLVAETATGTPTSEWKEISETNAGDATEFSNWPTAFSGGEPNIEMTFNYNSLIDMVGESTTGSQVGTSQATAGEVESTLEEISGPIDKNDISVQSKNDEWRQNIVSSLDLTISSPPEEQGGVTNSTVRINDGLGGVSTQELDLSSTTTSTFTIDGGPNDGAEVELEISSDNVQPDTESQLNFKVRGGQDGSGNARFDVRKEQSTDSEVLNTTQIVGANTENDLRVDFNEDRTNFINVQSINIRTEGLGLGLDEAQNAWQDRGDIEAALEDLDQARTRLRSASSSFSTNLNIITSREDFTGKFTDVLEEGSDKLTLADQNKEGVNLTTLQTRQQIGTQTLSIANQSQQNILSLLGGG